MSKHNTQNSAQGSQSSNSGHDPAVNDYRKHLWDAMRAGQEQHDKSLLALSSGGLAISLIMLKDVFGKSKLAVPDMLIGSWILFCLCILGTMVSFLTSQKCLRRRLVKYEESLVTGNDEKLKIIDPLERLTNCLNYASCTFLVLAVMATVMFASINLKRGNLMSNSTNDGRGYTPPPAPAQAPTVKPGMGYIPPQAPTSPPPTPGKK